MALAEGARADGSKACESLPYHLSPLEPDLLKQVSDYFEFEMNCVEFVPLGCGLLLDSRIISRDSSLRIRLKEDDLCVSQI